MYYLYDGHLGNLFVRDHELEPNEQYCWICNDYDALVGSFDTIQDIWELVKDRCDIDGCGGISLQYLYDFLCENFKLPDVYSAESEELSDQEILVLIDTYKDVKYVEQ